MTSTDDTATSQPADSPPAAIASAAGWAGLDAKLTPEGWQIGAGPDDPPMPWRIAVAELGVIRVTGPEARSFLNGQLTSNIEQLAPGALRLAAWCSPKGRILASMWVAAMAPEHFALVLSRELVAPIARRLKMFVLRAKVSVEPLDESVVPIALIAPPGHSLIADADAPMSVSGDGSRLRLGDCHFGDQHWTRTLWLTPLEQWRDRWRSLDAAASASGDAYRAGEILAGEARIVPATADRFVPQMVNLELLGGVDFAKGCYAGQEVIARSQNLGKLKRRMLPALASRRLSPAEDLGAEAQQIEATVVSCASAAPIGRPDRFLCLLETTAERAQAGRHADLGLEGIEPLDLPYAIPEHKPFERPRF
ncbi:MAG: hypothetical protein R3E87_16045 [Burkholderiaceae bacterium]